MTQWRFYVGPHWQLEYGCYSGSSAVKKWLQVGLASQQETRALRLSFDMVWVWWSCLMLDGIRADKMTKNDSLQWELTQQSHGRVEFTEKSSHEVSQSNWRSVFRNYMTPRWWWEGPWLRSKAFLSWVRQGFHLSRFLALVKRGATAGRRLIWRCKTAPFPPYATGNDWSITRHYSNVHRKEFYWSRPGTWKPLPNCDAAESWRR